MTEIQREFILLRLGTTGNCVFCRGSCCSPTIKQGCRVRAKLEDQSEAKKGRRLGVDELVGGPTIAVPDWQIATQTDSNQAKLKHLGESEFPAVGFLMPGGQWQVGGGHHYITARCPLYRVWVRQLPPFLGLECLINSYT